MLENLERYFNRYSILSMYAKNESSFPSRDEIGSLKGPRGLLSLWSSCTIYNSSGMLWFYPITFVDYQPQVSAASFTTDNPAY